MRYALILMCGFFALLWERLWRRFWPAVTSIVFYAALALFGVPFLFGGVWQLFLLALFAVAFIIALLKGGAPFVFPTRAVVERRLEQASGLPHRPLQTRRDKPAGNLAPEAEPLWRKHLEKAAAAMALLKFYKPQTDVARRDPWRLRYLALLCCALGLLAARHDAPSRLRQSFTPDFGVVTGAENATLDLWIEPPAYTHDATVFLSSADQGLTKQTGPLSVPAGSVLKLRLAGLRFAPRVSYAGRKIATTKAAPRNYTRDMTLEKSGTLTIGSLFHRIGAWHIAVLKDTPPTVSIVKIKPTSFAAVQITYKANDDHAITKLSGIVAVHGKAYTFAMPPTTSKEAVSDTEDLTENPWAGEKAQLWLDAKDGAGHITSSAPVSFTLPERQFNNPLAQRIINDRKMLIHIHSKGAYNAAIQDFSDIAENLQAYNGDFTVFLSLSSAAHRLAFSKTDATPPSVIKLLWNLALRLEDGGVTQARLALDKALQRLQQAIADKTATKQQMQELLDNAKKAMQQYLVTLTRELAQRLSHGASMPHLSPELTAKLLQNIDVSKLVAQMQALSGANSLQDLQKEAAALKHTLDNFNLDAFRKMQEQQAKALQALQDLQDVIHRQQDLYDKTNETQRKPALRKERKTQTAISGALKQLMDKLDNAGIAVPDSFADARAAMGKSADALGRAQRDASLVQQKIALDDLKKGMDSTTKQISQALQRAFLPFGMMSGGYGDGFDPLGRPYGLAAGTGVKIPDKGRQRQVQKIIEELQRRESDPSRGNVERNYVNRLLDQF